MTSRVTIVTSSDDRYAPLLFELIDSIRIHPQSKSLDVSVISAGMSEEVASQARERADNFAEGRWDLPVSERRYRGREWLKGRTVKVFLPDYFPGYDYYIWLDADCWVCDWRAIDLFLLGAERAGLAMGIDEVSADHRVAAKTTWLFGRYPIMKTFGYKHSMRAYLPMRMVKRLTPITPFNGGAFALHRDAPHWKSVQGHLTRLTKRARIFGSNQLAFVMAVELDGLPVEILPNWCNYIGVPKVCARTGRFVEPYLPHEPIGVLHLANKDDARLDPDWETDLLDTEGNTVRRTLRYRPEFVVADQSHSLVE